MTHGHQLQAEMMLVYGAPSFFQQIGVEQLHETTGFLVSGRLFWLFGGQ